MNGTCAIFAFILEFLPVSTLHVVPVASLKNVTEGVELEGNIDS